MHAPDHLAQRHVLRSPPRWLSHVTGKNKGGRGIIKRCSLCSAAGRDGTGHRRTNCPYRAPVRAHISAHFFTTSLYLNTLICELFVSQHTLFKQFISHHNSLSFLY